ncbi:DUF3488 and transglutaminase-like domain-containing protein [Spirillospora sp. NBC_00431]
MNRARAVLELAAVTLSIAAAAPLVAAGYDRTASAMAVLTATAALSVAVTAVAHRSLPAPGYALPAGLPVAAGWLVMLAVLLPGPVDGPVPAAVDAVLHSGARILTTASLAPVNVAMLAFPVVAAWLAAAAATVLRRDGRALPALAPGTLLLIGAAILNPGQDEAGYRSAVLLAIAGGVLLALPRPGRSHATPTGLAVQVLDREPLPGAPFRRRSRTGAAVLACAVCLPGAGAAAAATALEDWPVRADDPRTVVGRSEQPRDVRNPLAHLSAWASGPGRPLLTVKGPRTSLRWVSLAEFTGATWLPDSSYRPAGPALPAPDVLPPRTARVSVDVTVGALPGYWLPVPGAPTRVDGIRVGHDTISGTLLASDGPVQGRSYRASGIVPDWRGGEAARADAATGIGNERYLRLPAGAPARLAQIARAAAGDGTAHQRAARLAEYLRDTYTIDPGAPSGHGYADLNELLVPPGRKGGGATSEQFAAAFAVLAREAGLPSRVVVGFGPGSGGVVRTGDAVAWGEICFEGLGWVPYDPNPRARSGAAPRPGPDGDAPGGDSSGDGPTTESGGGGATDARPDTSGGPPLVIFLIALPVLFAVAVPLLRLRPRRPRGTDRAQTLTAWTNLLTALRLAGLPAPPSATVSEVMERLAQALPDVERERLRRVSRPVDAAGFGGPVTARDAAHVNAEVAALTAALRKTLPRPRRLLWWWDPRPLLWAAQPSRLTRRVQTGSAWATRSTSRTATTVRQ